MTVEKLEENRMGNAKMLPLILSMSLPAMFSMLIQALYNIVDSYFVAQVSDKAVSALSLAYPIQNLLIAFAVGTAAGVTSLISRRLGEGRREEAESAAVHGVVLSVITWAAFAVFGAFFTTPFFRMFESDPEIVRMGNQYLSICCIFSFGQFVVTMLEKIMQATGNMFWPMIFQLVGAVVNIVVDPILIFGWFGLPAMGVTGAAIATVSGQILAMMLSIVVTARRQTLKITFKGFRFHGNTVKNIYAVGIPAIVMQAISTVMNMAINAILAAFSTAAYTVFGLYFKLRSFVFMPVLGLNQGLMPIMGYNYGAKKQKRLMQSFYQGSAIALVIMLVGVLAFMLLPGQLLGFFNPTSELLEVGIPALRIISLCFPLAALGLVSSNMYQAIGKGNYSLIMSLMRQLVVLVPVAWLLAKLTNNVNMVWWAFPIAETVSLAVSIFFLVRLYKNELCKQEKTEIREECTAENGR